MNGTARKNHADRIWKGAEGTRNVLAILCGFGGDVGRRRRRQAAQRLRTGVRDDRERQPGAASAAGRARGVKFQGLSLKKAPSRGEGSDGEADTFTSEQSAASAQPNGSVFDHVRSRDSEAWSKAWSEAQKPSSHWMAREARRSERGTPALAHNFYAMRSATGTRGKRLRHACSVPELRAWRKVAAIDGESESEHTCDDSARKMSTSSDTMDEDDESFAHQGLGPAAALLRMQQPEDRGICAAHGSASSLSSSPCSTMTMHSSTQPSSPVFAVHYTDSSTEPVRQRTLYVPVANKTLRLDGLGLGSVKLESVLMSVYGRELEEVSLAANAISELSLGACTSWPPALRSLHLHGNELRAIDLAPLSGCLALTALWLQNNKIRVIDLGPLRSCSKLSSLYLDNNGIDDQSIDLAPLRGLTKLRSLRLQGNRLAGALDISPLLDVPALVSLTVSEAVTLYVVAPADDFNLGSASLSPALAKLKTRIQIVSHPDELAMPSGTTVRKWGSKNPSDEALVENKQIEQIPAGEDQPMAKALLLNFSVRDYYLTRDMMHLHAHFECTGVSDVLYDSEGLNDYDIMFIDVSKDLELAYKTLKEIRMICPYVPVVCIGADLDPLSRSKLTKLGVDRIFEEALTVPESLQLRKLAEERWNLRLAGQRARAALRSAAAVQTKRSNLSVSPSDLLLHRSSVPAPELTSTRPDDPFCHIRQGQLPPLSSLRRSQTLPQEAIGGLGRQELEEQALEKLLARYEGHVRLDQFSPVTTLCGLPSCASPLLFNAILLSSGSVSRDVVTSKICMRFWSEQLRFRTQDQRLFVILETLVKKADADAGNETAKVPQHRVKTHEDAFLVLAQGLIRGFRRQLGPEMDILRTVAALLMYICSGNISIVSGRITERGLVRSRFCQGLIAAESYFFDGLFVVLDSARLLECRSTFEALGGRVSDDPELACGLYIDKVVEYCTKRGTVIPRGVAAVFSSRLGRGWMSSNSLSSEGDVAEREAKKEVTMSLPDFALFWASMQDVAQFPSFEYWFSVLDCDMDGFVSREDAHHFYAEKCRLHSARGVFLADFSYLWSSLTDLACPETEHRGFSLKQLRRLPRKHRGFVIQALLWFDDGNAVVDVKRSGNSFLT
ncbi:Internalin-A [Porphyridium purpureum]|uniref:Internalin-A n=1 Tax=Porphyridium purpureum TaxID=35688 RepID=A0A5J4YVE0_PORPP|nr:Internalin-A [Porphyridium purpureum]|eukprot:POR8188..scf227_4